MSNALRPLPPLLHSSCNSSIVEMAATPTRLRSRSTIFNRKKRSHFIQHNSTANSSFAEVAGGTTADCAALVCCCPCGIVNLLVLAVYKVPKGLCRRALRHHRKRHGPRLISRKELLSPRCSSKCRCGVVHCDESPDIQQLSSVLNFNSCDEGDDDKSDTESEKAFSELEKEMLERFYGTGFFRSLSQKDLVHER